jgi:hypothetical protein
VYARWVPGGCVFLDLKCNRYSALGEDDALTLAQFLEDPLAPAARAQVLADRLRSAGLLEPCPTVQHRPFSAAHIDLRSGLEAARDRDLPSPRVGPRELQQFMLACLRSKSALRYKSLFDIASDIRAARQAKREPDTLELDALCTRVALFRSVRPYVFAARDRCLFQALALMKFALAGGISPQWVIGVRLKPWAAHSWVQHGSLLLDTSPEIVRDYAPIVAV